MPEIFREIGTLTPNGYGSVGTARYSAPYINNHGAVELPAESDKLHLVGRRHFDISSSLFCKGYNN